MVCSSFVVALLATQLWTSRPPEPPTTWFVAIDTSGSVPVNEFAEYPAIVRATVLRLMRPGDSVVLLGVLDPRATPAVPTLRDRPVHFQRDLVAIDEQVQAIGRASGPHKSDLGGVVAHAAMRMTLDTQLRSGAGRYVVVIVTDGVPDGQQTKLATTKALRQAPAGDWRVLFVGVAPAADVTLSALTAAAGLSQADRVRVVPFQFWRQVKDQLPAFLGRAVNPRIDSLLNRRQGARNDSQR